MPARAPTTRKTPRSTARKASPARGRPSTPKYNDDVVQSLLQILTSGQKSKRTKSPLTLERAEALWELAKTNREPNVAATLTAIANGGGRGAGGVVKVEDDAARWLTARISSAFGEGEDGGERSSARKSGTKRNLSTRFEDGSDVEDGEEAASEERERRGGTSPRGERAAKRRRLTVTERLMRRVTLATTRSTSKELRIIDGVPYDRAACAIVDESLKEKGKVDSMCARAVELSVKATGSRYGITPAGLQTLRMIVEGGVDGHYTFQVDAAARKHLGALIADEESLGPEILLPTVKRRKVAAALQRLSNFARQAQYRTIDGVKYDENACHIADVATQTQGKIGLACAKAIHASIEDGGSHWGITDIELRTIEMIIEGGRADYSYVTDAAAMKYLKDLVVNERSKREDAEIERVAAVSEARGNAAGGVLAHVRKLVRPKFYRYIDSQRYDEKACEIADDCMERIGRINLECAKEIHESILDGGSRWGITSTEFATIQLFLDGGRDDVLYICDDDARMYLLDILGTKAIEETENVTPPTKVQVRRQSPASALQSALKNPPPSALRHAAAKSVKKKGVNFTPAKRFELRTYIPSPTSGNTSEEEIDDDDDDDEVEVLTEQDEEMVEEEADEVDEDEQIVEVATTKRSSVRMITYSRPSIMTAFYRSMQFWMTPVSVLDTAAACLATAASFLVAHVFIIAALEATITPSSIKSLNMEAKL